MQYEYICLVAAKDDDRDDDKKGHDAGDDHQDDDDGDYEGDKKEKWLIRVDAIVRMDERIIRREIFAITAEGVKTVLERLLALRL